MPTNNYFAIGFGPVMANTDMILWQANGKQSMTSDMWSTSAGIVPINDTAQNLISSYVINANDTVTFTTTRYMNTKDSKQDFVFPYGTAVTMCYATLNSATFSYHSSKGYFLL